LLSLDAAPNVVGMEQESKRTRRQYSEAERKALLAAWHSSGESAARFGERHGVHASNLVRWSGGAGRKSSTVRSKRSAAEPAFVELRPAVQHVAAARDQDAVHIEIECPNGLKLRASRYVDVEMVGRLVVALGGIGPC